MAKKCCCCSSFFSCLACFSGNTHPPVDSRESATNLMDASTHAIPNACPDAQFFSPAANSTVSPAAATEEADGRRHDPHTIPSASAPLFQAFTSHDASSSADCASANSTVSPAAATEEADGRRHDPQTIPSASAPPFQAFTSHDASSSADCASTSAVPTQDAPASGGPSSSFPTESDIIKKISEAAEVDKKDGNVNLEGLIQHVSELLEFMKKNELDKKRSSDHHLPKSSVFVKLKEVLSEAIEAASSLKGITSLLNGIGQAHWATAGLLVVSNVLERFEEVSANRDECLGLLGEMYELAKYVKQLKERPRLRKGMEDLIQNALEMIVKASLMCCVQISSSKFSRFFSASVDKGELLKFQAELEKMSKHMKTRFDICLYDAVDCRKSRQRTPLEREYPDYAVGIEEPLKEVEKLLEWESEKKAVAVIVYGFGGVGKSTLADAVFARLDIVGCKYSMVRLFDNITSTPNVVEVQKRILRDLMIRTEEEEKPMLEVPTFENGQYKISRILEKEVAFIYIDNVLNSDRLQEVLPRNMDKTKKLRVLITARDKSVRKACNMETKSYPMNVLPDSEAIVLLNKEMTEVELASNQLNHIIEICGRIPKLLTVVAGFIRSEEDKQKAFRILIQDQKQLKGQAFGDGIEHYVFAYDLLPEMCKEPFLDICIFFKGMNWDSVADILGESELDMLEKRALVSKDRSMTLSVHDVILKIGSKRAEETRFNFTNANRSKFEKFLEKDIPGIKGLWFDVYENPSDIPATKLDSMSNSLKILRLGNLKVKGKCDKRFEKLVFFQGKVPHLPFNISQMPSNLKHMELCGEGHSDVFEISSNDLQQLRNLRILRLISFARLEKLPEELGEILHELRELTLSRCTSIEELPRSIAKLQYLRVLKMDHSYKLKKLPEELGEMLHELRELSLSHCTSIEELPRSIAKLKKLRELRMDHSDNLRRLPEDFGLLNSLQVLDLSSCEKLSRDLKDLPKDFEKFEYLNPFNPFRIPFVYLPDVEYVWDEQSNSCVIM